MKNTLLYAGGAVALVYVFTRISSAATATANSLTVPGAPSPPASWDRNYYLTYQYPAMLAANPEIANPNHILTAQEAAQYEANSLNLQGWVNYVLNVTHDFSTAQQALQYHWSTYGAVDKGTFLPLIPPDNTPFVPAPVNKNSSGSSSATLNTIISVAGGVLTALI